MARRTTAYRRVAQDLRDQIADGRLKPRDRIPSLTALQEAYGCSDTVILEARKVLVAEGLLVAKTGDGTYVRGRPDPLRLVYGRPEDREQPLFRLELGEAGLFPDVVTVEPEESISASAAVAAALGVRAGRKVRRSVRLFRHEGEAVQLVTVHALVSGRAPAVALSVDISARPASDAEGRALGGVAGQSLLVATQADRPEVGAARLVETVVLAERFTLVYRPEGAAG
ncbi:GntR family transcriptional regulator [Streptomyces sp. NPDC056084]|uniref:GntR family transcriptional regulator n=1 Tax=unclassified Streptomyces TaxID=2593676 RepID=UPI0035DCD99F